MTDEATTPSLPGGGEGSSTPDVQWAPPTPKKRRWAIALWIGVPVLALAGGAVWAGTNLIAPGVSVAGVPLGGLTESAAAERLSSTVASTDIDVTIDGVTATFTGADLGASVDAQALAADAFSTHPLWNVGSWFPQANPTEPEIDADAAAEALSQSFTSVWEAPTDAAVTFDAASGTYVVAEGALGKGIAVDTAVDAYLSRLTNADAPASIDAKLTDLEPLITTETAAQTAADLNALIATAGFYVGEERTVPIDPATFASWVTVSPNHKQGTIDITADAASIQATVDGLAPLVNREAAGGSRVLNSSGTVLRVAQPGLDGRVLGDTSDTAQAFAEQIAALNGAYQLPVEVTPAPTTDVVRLLEVDISEQRLYLKENGAVVDSWLVSTGLPGADTPTGNFRVQTHVRSQTMTGINTANGSSYDIPNVQYVMYFQGDFAFHGVHWRDNWGQRGSNGCIGMSNARAQQIYEWADQGTDIYIHY